MEKLLDPVEQQFIKDINTNVTDDGVRLIYADYLEDHGEPERAEFIRLQIQRYQEQLEDSYILPVYERELELWKKHSKEWYKDLGAFLRWVEINNDHPDEITVLNYGPTHGCAKVERGFLHHVHCSVEIFDQFGTVLGDNFPLDSLYLSNVSPDCSVRYRFWVCNNWIGLRRPHQVPFYFYPNHPICSYVLYDTQEEAMRDLTRRALNWAKGIPND